MTSQSATEPSGKSRVPVNAALLSSSQFARTVIGFVFFLFLARWLGPEDYGKYMFAFAFSEIFSILGDFGLHEYTIREMSRRPRELRERLAGVLGLKTALSSFSALLMIALLPFLGKDPTTSLAVAAFAVAQIGYSWFYSTTIAYSVRQDLHIQAFLWLLEKAVFAAAGVALLLAGRSFLAVAFSHTAVQFGGGALSVWLVWKKYGPFRIALDRERWRGYLKAALPFGLIVAFYLVYFRIDSVMISFFRGDEEVGLYNGAYNLISALMFLPSGLVAALFPRLAGAFRRPTDNLDGPFQRASRWLLAMSVPMAVGGSLLAREITQMLLGETYLPAALALAVLSWTLPVWFITFLQGNLLTIIERQKAVAVVGAVNMAANVALNLIVIPRYGFTGAAATTLATEIIGLTQMFWLLKRNISLTRTAWLSLKVAAVALVMGGLILVLKGRLHPAAIIAAAAVFYAVAVTVLRVVDPGDLKMIFTRRAAPEEAVDMQPPSASV
ncbi:MAG: flippase [Thermoleophilia bacterium]|nr:flippase [Thermoleophilia bacterium]